MKWFDDVIDFVEFLVSKSWFGSLYLGILGVDDCVIGLVGRYEFQSFYVGPCADMFPEHLWVEINCVKTLVSVMISKFHFWIYIFLVCLQSSLLGVCFRLFWVGWCI